MRRVGMDFGLLCSGIASVGVLAVLLVLACAGTAAGVGEGGGRGRGWR